MRKSDGRSREAVHVRLSIRGLAKFIQVLGKRGMTTRKAGQVIDGGLGGMSGWISVRQGKIRKNKERYSI